uniref:Uncharacterized protein n=1 Tax=Lactuca sativa TaxID=4236 RepID=A0A9R1XPB0_LACSA|nr:hypothetical protein LSAT_V11C200060910 [Lactuca sativa]
MVYFQDPEIIYIVLFSQNINCLCCFQIQGMKTATIVIENIIVDSFTDNTYHLNAGILVIVFVIVDIRSQELSEQGFNISLKEV